ncbi:hypothetical protein GOODEAATRI_027771 [Goodea atripinnis]|uniref:Uncharacterized protein n=1 Tax=Goodea atripinnis TaxID=208336 RepID=A0ABV0NNQ7_9TELE
MIETQKKLRHHRIIARACVQYLCPGLEWPCGVFAIWVHGWICIDSCQRGLLARCCSSLGLLHCDCWVVPLGLSSAALWGGCGSPRGGPPFGPGGQVCGSSHSLWHIFMEKPYKHKRAHTYTHRCWIQVLTETQMFYIAPHLPPNTSCIR